MNPGRLLVLAVSATAFGCRGDSRQAKGDPAREVPTKEAEIEKSETEVVESQLKLVQIKKKLVELESMRQELSEKLSMAEAAKKQMREEVAQLQEKWGAEEINFHGSPSGTIPEMFRTMSEELKSALEENRKLREELQKKNGN